jgi:hypothetical protein
MFGAHVSYLYNALIINCVAFRAPVVNHSVFNSVMDASLQFVKYSHPAIWSNLWNDFLLLSLLFGDHFKMPPIYHWGFFGLGCSKQA